MQDKGKYDTAGLIEAQFEPGSRGRVLKNLLGIKSKREMDRIEAQEQFRALRELMTIYGTSHRFTAADVRKIHKAWLGDIYEWAGNYRQVNISKGGFLFAAAHQVHHLMAEFEKGPLRKYTPCMFTSIDEIAGAIAAVHVELVLIHPFREGNGRVARMLAVLMALQAGMPLLDFSDIRGKKKTEYFAAVQAGMDRDYGPMTKVFNDVIRRTLRTHGRQ
jgi:cell filamentation protein